MQPCSPKSLNRNGRNTGITVYFFTVSVLLPMVSGLSTQRYLRDTFSFFPCHPLFLVGSRLIKCICSYLRQTRNRARFFSFLMTFIIHPTRCVPWIGQKEAFLPHDLVSRLEAPSAIDDRVSTDKSSITTKNGYRYDRVVFGYRLENRFYY